MRDWSGQEANTAGASSSTGLVGDRPPDAAGKEHPSSGSGAMPLNLVGQSAGLPDLAFDQEGLFDDDEDETEGEEDPIKSCRVCNDHSFARMEAAPTDIQSAGLH